MSDRSMERGGVATHRDTARMLHCTFVLGTTRQRTCTRWQFRKLHIELQVGVRPRRTRRTTRVDRLIANCRRHQASTFRRTWPYCAFEAALLSGAFRHLFHLRLMPYGHPSPWDGKIGYRRAASEEPYQLPFNRNSSATPTLCLATKTLCNIPKSAKLLGSNTRCLWITEIGSPSHTVDLVINDDKERCMHVFQAKTVSSR
jgi:hypothetical protein